MPTVSAEAQTLNVDQVMEHLRKNVRLRDGLVTTVEEYTTDKTGRQLTNTMLVCFDGRNLLMKVASNRDDKRELIEGANEDYVFALVRFGDKPYAIQYLALRTDVEKRESPGGQSIEDAKNVFYAGLRHGDFIWNSLSAQGVKNVSLQEADDGRVDINYDREFTASYLKNAELPADFKVEDASFQFDPQFNWCLSEIKRPQLNNSMTVVKLEYEDVDGIGILPTKVDKKTVAEEEVFRHTELIFTSWSRDGVPSDQFYLSGYGFDEPDLNALNKNRLHWALWIVPVVLIGVGVRRYFAMRSGQS